MNVYVSKLQLLLLASIFLLVPVSESLALDLCAYPGTVPQSLEYTDDCDGKTPTELCSVSCATGYFGTPESWVCQNDLNFIGSIPVCIPQVCDQSSYPAGVGVVHTCEGATTGQTCAALCDEGYAGSPESLTCGPSGSFIGSSPTCTPQVCIANLPAGVGVTHDCDGKTTGQTCAAQCAEGYTGNTELLTCDASQVFIGSSPVCTPADTDNDGVLDISDNFPLDPRLQTGNEVLPLGSTYKGSEQKSSAVAQ